MAQVSQGGLGLSQTALEAGWLPVGELGGWPVSRERGREICGYYDENHW